jgi:hypothetical protein
MAEIDRVKLGLEDDEDYALFLEANEAAGRGAYLLAGKLLSQLRERQAARVFMSAFNKENVSESRIYFSYFDEGVNSIPSLTHKLFYTSDDSA